MIRVAEYTALSGAVVRATYDVRKARQVCSTAHISEAAHVLHVLDTVTRWNVSDARPCRKTWYEKVPKDVAEGLATAIVVQSALR